MLEPLPPSAGAAAGDSYDRPVCVCRGGGGGTETGCYPKPPPDAADAGAALWWPPRGHLQKEAAMDTSSAHVIRALDNRRIYHDTSTTD